MSCPSNPPDYQTPEPGSLASIQFAINEIERHRERLEADVLIYLDGWRDDYDACKDMYTDLLKVGGGFRLTEDAVSEFLTAVGW